MKMKKIQKSKISVLRKTENFPSRSKQEILEVTKQEILKVRNFLPPFFIGDINKKWIKKY